MTIDWTINFGHLLTLGGTIIGVMLTAVVGYVFIVIMRRDVDLLAKSMEKIVGTINQHTDLDLKQFDGLRREFGEVSHAIRQKITEVEFWVRDRYLPQDSFSSKMGELHEIINSGNGKLEDWLLRIEKKIDSREHE